MKGSRGIKGQMKKEAFDGSEADLTKIQGAMKDLSDKLIKQGLPMKDALGLNAQVLEGIYAQAYRLYNTGKYIEATHIFRMLVLFDPTEPKYLLGLAACLHMLKEYHNAIATYTMCAVLDPKSPVPHYHASDCYIQMKDFVSAAISLDMAIQKAGGLPEYAKMKERALLSLESIKKQIESGQGSESE